MWPCLYLLYAKENWRSRDSIFSFLSYRSVDDFEFNFKFQNNLRKCDTSNRNTINNEENLNYAIEEHNFIIRYVGRIILSR